MLFTFTTFFFSFWQKFNYKPKNQNQLYWNHSTSAVKKYFIGSFTSKGNFSKAQLTLLSVLNLNMRTSEFNFIPYRYLSQGSVSTFFNFFQFMTSFFTKHKFLFLFFFERLNKYLYKYSNYKRPKYSIKYLFIPPYKRAKIFIKFFSKSIIFMKYNSFFKRFSNYINFFLYDSKNAFFLKLINWVQLFVFKNNKHLLLS